MNARIHQKNLPPLLFATGLALLLAGCVEPSGDRGVKLSGAMKASAQGSHSDIDGGSNVGSYDNDNDGPSVALGANSLLGANYAKRDFGYQLLADVSYQRPLNGPINSMTRFTLTPIAVEDEHNFIGLYIGGGTVDLKTDSLANQAIKDVWTFDAGMNYRYFIGPSWTGFCPYLGCSLGGTILEWTYRHAVVAGGDSISSDNLGGAEGTVSFGFATQRDRRLSAFAEAGVGGTVFYDTTTQGFENDVFNDFGYLFVKAGLSLKF